ncbi:MAG: erg26, C-3 sterol dehydrogenase [Alectoria fallacina]|uniref:Erg26, C-3 sterol dehydrogenase n=1 Tax=Alectoria fallacina TaxID=1903189 RepID=A0A8H3IKN2_9LECA|nr:MAG: erg26, C-3 sterol dehydrogenase [Alectoria fallacina]
MAAGPEHINLDESTLLADSDSNSYSYVRTKAQADIMVLKANRRMSKQNQSGLLTACIRLPIVYGERDLVSIPGALAALEKNQTNFQLGDGSNMWDFASADNAAKAHILLAEALLRSVEKDYTTPKVDGEAFNITDGQPHLFWDFPLIIWKAAGWEPPADRAKKMVILPTRLALVIAVMMEWIYWVVTLGTQRPGLLSKQQVWISCYTHTYRIDKAKERLGYKPVPDFEAGIQKAVAWLLEEGGWGPRLQQPQSTLEKPETKSQS